MTTKWRRRELRLYFFFCLRKVKQSLTVFRLIQPLAPWWRVRCILGSGASAANRTMNATGSITLRVVPSRHRVLS